MGVDIGGFFGPNPEPELFLRWIPNGVFHPRFCIHSYKTIATEADMYQKTHHEFFEIIQKFMKLRKELIPYIKESAQKANQQGIPIMRPTVYDFQDEPETYEQSFEYMFGDKFFVAPIYKPLAEEKQRTFYLPGSNKIWRHYFTGEEFIGGRQYSVSVDFANIPVLEMLQFITYD
jgi:alpha-glucosidase